MSLRGGVSGEWVTKKRLFCATEFAGFWPVGREQPPEMRNFRRIALEETGREDGRGGGAGREPFVCSRRARVLVERADARGERGTRDSVGGAPQRREPAGGVQSSQELQEEEPTGRGGAGTLTASARHRGGIAWCSLADTERDRQERLPV